MNDSTGLHVGADLDNQRLSLLRSRLAERGLLSEPEETTEVSGGMTAAERRMWFVHSADPAGTLLNVCVSYRLTGAVDIDRLRGALDTVAAQNPVLRTTYHTAEDGMPYPVVQTGLFPKWSEHDLSELGAQARQLRLEVLAQREFGASFDLTTDSPLRISVVRTSPDELVLLLVAHHIAWDDASWRVFFAGLTAAYLNPPASLDPFLTASRRAQPVDDSSAQTEADLQYWRELLSDFPEPLELPGRNGSAVPSTLRAKRCRTRLSGETTARVVELAEQTGGTPYSVLLAAFTALLFRYSHAEDFLVAVPVLDRGSGFEDEIGYFGNTVALRMRPHGEQRFRDLAGAARETAMGAFAHQRITMDRVVAELNPDRRYGVERMVRVSFGFREPDGPGFSPPGVHSERVELRSSVAQLPLTAMVEFDSNHPGNGAEVEFEYLVEVLDASLVEQMLRSFHTLLEHALAYPDRSLATLAVMEPEDAAWLRRTSQGDSFEVPAATLAELVEEQAARTPDAVAVVYEGDRYTYRDIDLAANRFANWLIAHHVSVEDRVAVLLDKSPELVIAALGILKAGAVYTPVDPTYPPDRIEYILSDCDATLTLREAVADLIDYPADPPYVPATPNNTAYLIYTSGSTGLPKGVAVPHAPVAEYFRWFAQEYQVGNDDRLLQVASPSFDVSIGEIFGTLICGARLVIPKPEGLRDIGYLTDLLQRQDITSMHFVPSLLGLFLSLPGVGGWQTLRRVPIGGEALPGELADRFHATFDALLHNFYGPTETVVNATRYPVEGRQGSRTVPIGTPKINTSVHLLDVSLQPVPIGVIGEIYIGGTHLAHGYHRRPDTTAERFVADPYTAGGRLYRTGDLARRNIDGDIEFIGRADDQVKIRGFRIELGEVSAAIAVDPSVGQVAVLASEIPSLGRSLVAYIAPSAGADVDLARIKARVSEALPDYMTPACYVVVDEIPITANGKIDRDILPAPQIEAVSAYRKPADGTESTIARLFEQLLERSRVGADDSFFALGGHSLLATRLIAAVRAECNVDVDVREIFDNGSVAELANLINRRASGEIPSPRARLVPLSADGPQPLSASQLRSWFTYRVDGPSPVSNIPFAAEITGPCDFHALESAVRDVIARHEILRTYYCEIDGVPMQIVKGDVDIELRRSTGDGPTWVDRRLDEERRYCFDLESEFPVRAALLSTGVSPRASGSSADERHVLSVVVHHIASDHWSAGVLLADLLTAYRARSGGNSPVWAPLPVQYGDYAAWQAELLAHEGEIVSTQTEYWKNQLAGLPEHTGLAADLPRPRVLSGSADTISFEIDATTRAKLTSLCRDAGATEFMLLQAAVAVLLQRSGGHSDIPLGTPVAGRTEAALDQLVGFFINILVVRNNLSDDPTLREVLARARETALGAYAHQDLPFDRVVAAVSPTRSLSRNPLFSVVVHVREHWPVAQSVNTAGLVDDSNNCAGTQGGATTFTALEPAFDMAHADLSFNFFATEDAYVGSVMYRPELYRRQTVERLIDRLLRVLIEFADRPDTLLRNLTLLDDVERRLILEDWGRGEVFVLDDALRLVPTGVLGEVYYAGRQSVRGHCEDSELTASRFVANPFAGGTRLYRSGDRARWTGDGCLEIIEESRVGVPGTNGTPVGREPTGAGRPGEPPRSDTERALAAIFEQILDVPEVNRFDDFFTLGGDSILSVRLAARARADGLAVSPRMVFEHPTLEQLAAAVDIEEEQSGNTFQHKDTHHQPMTTSGLSGDELAALATSWSTAGKP